MSLADVVLWRWPTARCVVRGDVLEVWTGPDPQPTPEEIAQAVVDYAALTPVAHLAVKSLATSRRKDNLADRACEVRGRNVAAWNAMTVPQRVVATLAEADVWKGIREFIDDKV